MIELNTVYNECCFETMRKIDDGSIDLIVIDPPYEMTQNDWDKKVDFELLWSEINRIKKEDTAVIVFSAQPFTTDVIMSNRKSFRYSLVWDKVLPVGFLNANKMPLRSHEDICVFYDKLPYYNPVKSTGHSRKIVKNRKCENSSNYGKFNDGHSYDSTERFPTSIMTFSNGGTRTDSLHPTQKPLELLKYILRMYAKKGFVVADFFGGSGTTFEACISLGIDYIGSENNEKYYKTIQKRLYAVQGSLL